MRLRERNKIRRLPLFVDVEAGHTDALLRNSCLQCFSPNIELAREGESADFLHVVVDGQVEVFSTYRDRETTVAVIGPGQTVLVAAVILDKVCLGSARTLSPARVLLVPAEAVRQLFYADAAFARALALELAQTYRGIMKELKNQKLRSTIERLANFLLTHYEQSGAKGSFMLPFEKKVLASRLGMAPEVLSRSFMALVPHRIRVCGAAVEVHDVEALRNLAKPSSTIDDPAV
jgi:CRP/FNR family transcriptional activator FtrB